MQERTVSAFLRELRAMPGWDDTVVVFVSDHGEEFREHGGMYHLTTLFDEQVRIPGWLVAGPRALDAVAARGARGLGRPAHVHARRERDDPRPPRRARRARRLPVRRSAPRAIAPAPGGARTTRPCRCRPPAACGSRTSPSTASWPASCWSCTAAPDRGGTATTASAIRASTTRTRTICSAWASWRSAARTFAASPLGALWRRGLDAERPARDGERTRTEPPSRLSSGSPRSPRSSRSRPSPPSLRRAVAAPEPPRRGVRRSGRRVRGRRAGRTRSTGRRRAARWRAFFGRPRRATSASPRATSTCARCPRPSRDEAGPELAQKLGFVLERQPTLNLGKIPDLPEGDPAAKPPDTFVADTLYAGEEPVPITLKRVRFPDGVDRWLIAQIDGRAHPRRRRGLRAAAHRRAPSDLAHAADVPGQRALAVDRPRARRHPRVRRRAHHGRRSSCGPPGTSCSKTPTQVDDALVESSRRPLRAILWAFGFRLLLGPLQLTSARRRGAASTSRTRRWSSASPG